MKKLDIRPGRESLFYDEIGKRPIFVKFYMDGCPHCEIMKPAWEELENDLLNNYDGDFTIMSVNARSLNTLKGPIVENVQGFPTLFIINKNGTKGMDYNGVRTKDDMLSFLLHNKVYIHKKQSFSYPLNSFSSKKSRPMRSMGRVSRKSISRRTHKSRKMRGGRHKSRKHKKHRKQSKRKY